MSDSLAKNTAALNTSVFNTVERIIDPKRLSALDARQISKLQTTLRKEKKAEATIKAYLTHLKAALRWAKQMKLLRETPEIVMPKRANTMKGRAVTTEELERILDKVEVEVGTKAAESWKFLLKGLWWSGLRLGEALILRWNDGSFRLNYDLKRPMFQIQAEAEKGNKDRLLPMAPEFVEFLESVPEDERDGWVFTPMPQRNYGNRPRLETTSSIIVKIGKASGVKVNDRQHGKVKYASAHDLHRSLGCRWAMRVMPPVLMQMMRHENIQMTQQFYVGRNAEMAAEAIWDSIDSDVSPKISTRRLI